jgi:hypothetical protein
MWKLGADLTTLRGSGVTSTTSMSRPTERAPKTPSMPQWSDSYSKRRPRLATLTPRIVPDELRVTAPANDNNGRPRNPDSIALIEGRTLFIPGASHQQSNRKYGHLRRTQNKTFKLRVRSTTIEGQTGTLVWLEPKSMETTTTALTIQSMPVAELTKPRQVRGPRGPYKTRAKNQT